MSLRAQRSNLLRIPQSCFTTLAWRPRERIDSVEFHFARQRRNLCQNFRVPDFDTKKCVKIFVGKFLTQNLQHLLAFIAARNAKKDNSAPTAPVLTGKAALAPEHAIAAELVKLQLKQELLVPERLLLQSQLQQRPDTGS